MTNRKSTKRALLMSALSLLLCFSMLVGTTFAWFTDSVTSANNIIKSGELKVLMDWADGKADPASASTTWSDASQNAIFNSDLWEPGFVDVKHIRVTNDGSLALKYQLFIEPTGEVEALAEVIEVYVIEGGEQIDDRADLADKTSVGTLAQVINSFQTLVYGDITTKGESDIFTIALKMREDAGNDYQGKKIGDFFTIKVLATQFTYEEDSFGKDYDENAPVLVWDGETTDESWYDATKSSFELTTPAQLAGFVAIVNSGKDTFSGKTVALGASMDLSNKTWTPIGNGNDGWNNKFNGSFIGNGYTISNLHVEGTSGVGFFGYVGSSAHIEGVTIVNAYVSGNDYVGAVVGSGYLAKNCVKNCTVENATIIATPYLKDDGKTYDGGAKAGVVVGYAINGNITGNTAKNSTVSAYRDLGGIAGMVAGENRNVTVSGNTVENVTLSYLSATPYDGDKPNENMKDIVGRYDENKVIVTNNNGKCETVSAPLTTVADGLYKDGKNNLYVANAAGLATLNDVLSKRETNMRGISIDILSDIDFTDYTWTPVDSHADTSFYFSTINGNGHTISNLTINGQAMFKRFAGSGDILVQDLTFKNATVNSTALNSSILTVQTYQNTVLDNVDIIGASISGSYKVAPLIATVYNESESTITLTVKDCDVKDCTVRSKLDFMACGMVAWVATDNNEKIVFENCTVSDTEIIVGSIDYNATAYVYANAGNSEGCFNDVEGVTVTNCSTTAEINQSNEPITVEQDMTIVLSDTTIAATNDGESAITVKNSATLSLVVKGNVTLTGAKSGSGILVEDGATLNLTGDTLTTVGNGGAEYLANSQYATTSDTSFGGKGGSGIGGNGTINISDVTSLTANGYGVHGFGIGGATATVNVKNTTLSARGGYVNQTGELIDSSYGKDDPTGGAAIGGKVINLTNVTVTEALGGSKAAGIGALYHNPTTITIDGCVIEKVVGGVTAAGIGGSRIQSGDATEQDVVININNSIVTAQGGYFGAGIGSGYDTYCHTPDLAPMHTINITGNSVITAVGGKYAAGIGTGYHVAGLSGKIESTVTVNATAGESREKYTYAMNVGFGVIDDTREAGEGNNSSFDYQGQTITVDTAEKVAQ